MAPLDNAHDDGGIRTADRQSRRGAPMTVDTAQSEIPAPEPSDVPDQSGIVPSWLDRLAAIGWRVLVTLALLLVIGRVAIFLSTVTGAILVGLLIAALVYPVVIRLRTERGWPRGRAAAAASFLAVGLVLLALAAIVVAFIPAIVDILQRNKDGLATLSAKLSELGAPTGLTDLVNSIASNVQAWFASSLAELVAPIASFVTIMILGGFLTFYLLADGDRGWEATTSNIDDWRARALTSRATVALDELSGYLRGTSVMAVIDAASVALFLAILGVPFAGPLAVVVFIAAFVPYIGGLFSSTVIVLITVGTQGFLAAGAFLALVGVTNLLERRFVAPRVYGAGSRVNPGLALIAIPAAGALFGFVGLFAAVPVVTALQAFAPAIVEVLGTRSQTAQTNELVPVWLDRMGQFSWRALVVLGLLGVLVELILQPLLSLPLILALIFAVVLRPLVRVARQRGLGTNAAPALVTIASVAVVVLVLAVTILTMVGSLPDVESTAASGADHLNLGTTPSDLVHVLGGGLISTFAAVVTNLAGLVIALTIALLLTFYFLRDGARWWSTFLQFVPADRRDRVDVVGTQSASTLYSSMVGTAIVSASGGVMQWLTMFILGLPLAFPIGVLSFILGFIPYIGGAIATFLGFLVAVAVGSTTDIILMGIFTIVFNIVQGNIVTPLVYGKTVSIHPAVVLLAIPAGGAIAGIIGMVMIIPVLGIFAKTWRTVLHLFDAEQPRPAVIAAGAETPPAVRPVTPASVDGPASAPAAGT
jgi:putative heme transporter